MKKSLLSLQAEIARATDAKAKLGQQLASRRPLEDPSIAPPVAAPPIDFLKGTLDLVGESTRSCRRRAS
ncbi:MAG TPA: hypothetical protein VHE78_05075 [Gemmatimonadaceae bacterium]|nr:hypothetical protein [Gemmatimonadaceae bacterium]